MNVYKECIFGFYKIYSIAQPVVAFSERKEAYLLIGYSPETPELLELPDVHKTFTS